MKNNFIPKLVIDKRIKDITVDIDAIGHIMNDFGLPEGTIKSTTVYISYRPALRILGSVWPKYLARFRYPSIKPKGMVLRLSYKMYFIGTTERTINRTLVHEIEHVAQVARKDIKLLIGYATELVFLSAGIALGLTNESDSVIFRIAILLITSFAGLQVGYMFAMHEAVARKASANYRLRSGPITFD